MTRDKHPQRIAILGSRGIPARFGGFETFAEEIAVRLTRRGYRVTVFCEPRPGECPASYQGVWLAYQSTPSIAGLRSLWFDLMTLLRASLRHDLVFMLGYHSAFFYWIPRVLRRPLWVNMDGIEWRRAKWSLAVRRYLQSMEWLAVRFATRLVADADAIAEYLAQRHGVASKIMVIPYGATWIEQPPPADDLISIGVTAGDYYLVVCRFVPENHVAEIIAGFRASLSRRRLILVGDHRNRSRYARQLIDKKGDDPRIQFVGAIYDTRQLRALRYHARAYLHGHSVGGTNPSLLEAMAAGNFVIAHDNAFNREVTDSVAWYFKDPVDLAILINRLEQGGAPAAALTRFRELLRERYDWEHIADAYDLALQSAGMECVAPRVRDEQT